MFSYRSVVADVRNSLRMLCVFVHFFAFDLVPETQYGLLSVRGITIGKSVACVPDVSFPFAGVEIEQV